MSILAVISTIHAVFYLTTLLFFSVREIFEYAKIHKLLNITT